MRKVLLISLALLAVWLTADAALHWVAAQAQAVERATSLNQSIS